MNKIKISYVIPTYNSKWYLEQGLLFLAEQIVDEHTEMEVIVVDDGSTDTTADLIVQMKERFTHLAYIYRPRDALSCRSRTRNLGLKAATGDVICFLDSGVLVPPLFTKITAQRLRDCPQAVILHYMLGLELDPERNDTSEVYDITPDNIVEAVDKLRQSPSWQDVRDYTGLVFEDDFNKMNAPWEFGWSCALSASADVIREIGGFDEAFVGWGCEDIDFSYRMFKAGGHFLMDRNAFGLHIPHTMTNTEAKLKSNFDNSAYMHTKYYELPTEIHRYHYGVFFDGSLEKLGDIQMDELTAIYRASQQLNPLQTNEFRSQGPSLLIGCDDPFLTESFGVTDAFAYNPKVYESLKSGLTSTKVHYLLGIETPYADGHFEVAVVMDFIRLLNPFWKRLMLKELKRIAKKIVFVQSEIYEPELPLIPDGLDDKLMECLMRTRGVYFDQPLTFSPRTTRMMEQFHWTSIRDMKILSAQNDLNAEFIVV